MIKVTKQFVVTLKRVIYAEVKVKATSAAEARRIVNAAGAHEYFVDRGDSFHTDETTIIKASAE